MVISSLVRSAPDLLHPDLLRTCYTLDGTEPYFEGDSCDFESAVPLVENSILLGCDGIAGTGITRNIIVIYKYPPDPIYPPGPIRVAGEFTQDCSP